MLYPPLSNHIFYAQTQVVILLLVVVMMGSLESAHDRRAGLALVVAGLLKVFPLTTAGYFVLRRRWHVLGWMAIGLLAGIAAMMAAFGVERNVVFIAYVSTWFFAIDRPPQFETRPPDPAG